MCVIERIVTCEDGGLAIADPIADELGGLSDDV
jgi:adenine/guanine phosphoribosyltransferase-like PRPP-binding protein